MKKLLAGKLAGDFNRSYMLCKALTKRTRLAIKLRFLWPLTCVDLRGLALTLVELKFVRKSMRVFHRLATQRKSRRQKLITSQLYAKPLSGKLASPL